MKLSVLFLLPIVFLVFIVSSLQGQSAFQNPVTTNYLNSTILSKSAIRHNGMLPYDGVGKQFLLNEFSNVLVKGYSNTLLPTDYLNPAYGNISFNIIAPTNKRIDFNLQTSTLGELDGMIANRNNHLGWKNSNIINVYNSNGSFDNNQDGFRDLSKKQRFFGMTNHEYKKDRYLGSLSLMHMNVDELGGQMAFDKSRDFMTTSNYGFGKETQHTSLVINQKIRLGENYPKEKHSILFHNEGRWHNQNAFYGIKELTTTEQNFNSYLGYSGKYALSNFSAGVAYRHQNINVNYSEQFENIDYLINRWSAFANYNTFITKYFKLKTFLRLDRENETYEFYPNAKLNVIFGRGNRFPLSNLTLFAGREKQLLLPTMEYQPYFNSSRVIDFPNLNDNYYENTAYIGAAYQLKGFDLSRIFINPTKVIWKTIAIEDYLTATVTDGDVSNSGSLSFSRASERVFNHLLEVSTNVHFDNYRFWLEFRYRYNDFSNENIALFYPKHLFIGKINSSDLFNFLTATLGYYYQSGQIINENQDISLGNHRLDLNTKFRVNYWIKKKALRRTVYLNVGINNLTNYYEQNPIVGAENPFFPEYDGSLNWRNITGFNMYFGLNMDL